MIKEYIPSRGDLVWLDFDPTVGHEQAHKRPALVLSPEPFNKVIKLVLLAPITSKVKGLPFEVKLKDTKTKGVILCHQVRTVDYLARGIEFIEKAPKSTVDDALAKISVLVK